MKELKSLLTGISGIEIKGSSEIAVTGITANSKGVAPGIVFIAKKGKTFDGRQYIAEALQRGASAVVTDQYDPSLGKIVQIIHPNVLSVESHLVAAYYDHPAQELMMVGITGTNGKTTTSFVVRNLLEKWYGPCGLIGTIEYILGKQRQKASHTTPDVITNHRLLRAMREEGCRSAVMEVSSHALDQGRVDQIDFDVAIFSNLTLDHLDYHGTMEHYGQSKRLLFQNLAKGNKKNVWAIVNQDSPWTPIMLRGCAANVFTYGIDSPCDLQATQIRFSPQGTWAKIKFDGRSADCFWPLVGRFNVYNCLAAMAVALSHQISLDDVIAYMSKIDYVRGRLQPVQNALGLKIIVDFAHTDDALKNVLETLKEIQKSKGRLIVVFGCGGDRDKSKRPKMATVCEKYADLCIVTSDNPRSEEPTKICAEIIQGFTSQACYQVELDRRAAIAKAIQISTPDDTLLIAGKGHETYQIFADQTIEFDDCKVAAETCLQIENERKT